MITLSMAIEDKAMLAEVHACLETAAVRIDSEQQHIGDLKSFMLSLERSKTDVVLIDVSVLRDAQEVIAKLRLAAPHAMIVALSTAGKTGPVLECFRAGADEYLFPPLAEGLKASLDRRQTERRKSEREKPGGKIITFLSAKGGCGATTLACHVAAELSRNKHRVLLADLDIQAGMVAFLMKSASPYSIADAFNNVDRLDASYWKALVSNGIPGLDVISAPPAMVAAREPRLMDMRLVLEFASKHYQWTVTDAGRGISESTLTAIKASDAICLVTTPEIPALHQTKQILQRLLDAGYVEERIRLVVNRVPKRQGIRPEELGGMVGIPLFAAIPECYPELHEAYSLGQLLPARTVLGDCVARLAGKLAGAGELKPKRRLPFFG